MHIGLGELLALASALTWAVGVILYRQLGAELAPLRLNFLKNVVVLLGLLPATLWMQGVAPPPLSALEWIAVLGSGVLGIAIADTLYFFALNALGAGRMGVIGNLYSPMVVFLSMALLGEHLRPWQWFGFVAVSTGVLLAAWIPARWRGVAHAPIRGSLLGIASIALMAGAIVMIKPVLEVHPLLWVTTLRMGGALLAMPLLASAGGQLPQLLRGSVAVPWLRLVLAAGFGQGLAMVFWLGGYKYTSASIAAILNETASVFILLLAWVWLGERPSLRALSGVGLALTGVALILIG